MKNSGKYKSGGGSACLTASLRGFTLAEVLITLGVIGIVAALTIPTLLAKYQEKELETRYKKSRAILTNGYKLMMAKENVYNVSNLQFLKCENYNTYCFSEYHNEVFKVLDDNTTTLDIDNLPKEYAISNEEKKSFFSWEDVPYLFRTTEGMTYGVMQEEDLKSFSVIADVNGSNNPNTTSRDLFKFRFLGDGSVIDVTSELELLNDCSVKDYSGCTTAEACQAAGLSRAMHNSGEVSELSPRYCYIWNNDACEPNMTDKIYSGIPVFSSSYCR